MYIALVHLHFLKKKITWQNSIELNHLEPFCHTGSDLSLKLKFSWISTFWWLFLIVFSSVTNYFLHNKSKHFENEKHHFRHVITAPFEKKLMKPTKASYSKFLFDLFEWLRARNQRTRVGFIYSSPWERRKPHSSISRIEYSICVSFLDDLVVSLYKNAFWLTEYAVSKIISRWCCWTRN